MPVPPLERSTKVAIQNLLLQDLALCSLRVTKVHHFIQQFVYNDEVISDTLLLQFLEVFREDLHDLVEEQQDLGGICVSLREREDIKVTMADVEVLSNASGGLATIMTR